MGRFLKWRKMTWALLLWGGALVGVCVVSGASPLVLMAGALGLIVLSAVWIMTRPLWSQGHGLRFRRMRAVEVSFKPVKGFGSSPIGRDP
jgi:hypothetical protein